MVVKDGVVPSMVVVDETVTKEKISPLVYTSGSFPPLPTQATSSAGNTPGKSSYVNVTGKPSGKKLNIRTLFTPGGNGIDVVVPVESIRAISDRFANTAYGFFLGEEGGIPHAILENGPWFIQNNPLILKKWHLDENLLKEDVSTVPVWVKLHGVPVTTFSDDGLSVITTKLGTPLMLDSYTSNMCLQSWGRSSYARVMIELRADVELKDNIVVAMPRIKEEGYCTCNIHNIGVDATKNLKKTSQTPKGISVGQKMGFIRKHVFQPVSKKSTANTFGKKMNNSESTKEVSKSNPFEVLTSVDNDVDLGTNRGVSNSADKGTNNVSYSNTPIGEKIDKIERQICEGKLWFVDDDWNPLVPTCIVESDSEVEVVFDETTNLRILTSGKDESDKGYGTNNLLEQWM
ncbi:beta-caryophyllene synthase, partial [Tanacetum coccineum]